MVRTLDDQGLTFTVHNMPGEASSVRPKMVCVIILVNLVIMAPLLLFMYSKIRFRMWEDSKATKSTHTNINCL